MKTTKWVLAVIIGASLAIAGCGKRIGVDTSAMEKSFQSAEAAVKSEADSVVSVIKSEDYSGALTKLQTLAKNAKLTPEQQQTINDVLAQVQKVLADAAAKGAADAGKAASDLQKALPK